MTPALSSLVTAVIAPAVIAGGLVAALRGTPLARWLADRPNERSLHSVPTPRVGGIAVMCGAVPVAAWHADAAIALLLACACALAVLSLADDLRSLPAGVRLAAHLAAAGVAAYELAPGVPAFVAVLLVVGIAWMTNLFNFMDGADGVAGGMAAIGFGAYATAAYWAGDAPLAIAGAAFASAAIGFLAWNFPPARVFLGDAGSIPLGFAAGGLGLAGAIRGAWPPWFPVLVFSPFIVDATLTLLRRTWSGERPWRAHRGHYYQRLVLSGWAPRRLALRAYLLMAACAIAALAARTAGFMLQCGIISAAALLYALLILAIDAQLPPAGGGSRPRPH